MRTPAPAPVAETRRLSPAVAGRRACARRHNVLVLSSARLGSAVQKRLASSRRPAKGAKRVADGDADVPVVVAVVVEAHESAARQHNTHTQSPSERCKRIFNDWLLSCVRPATFLQRRRRRRTRPLLLLLLAPLSPSDRAYKPHSTPARTRIHHHTVRPRTSQRSVARLTSNESVVRARPSPRVRSGALSRNCVPTALAVAPCRACACASQLPVCVCGQFGFNLAAASNGRLRG